MFQHLSRSFRALSPALSQVCNRSVSGSALSFQSFGDPKKVLAIQNVDVGAPGANQARIKVVASPINPADLNIVQGTYGALPSLPAVGGMEGAGVVEEVGSGVKSLKVGDLVATSRSTGLWQSHAIVDEASTTALPAAIDPVLASVLSVNPCTAVRLLEDFAQLKAGDVVVQNGANSMVGQSVIQLAKKRGIRTVNIIRDRPQDGVVIEMLKNQGGDVVVTESFARTPEFQQVISDLPAPALGLNATGGRSATDVARLLGEGASFVTYGGMSHRPVQLPTSLLIFRGIKCQGFWLDKWIRENGDAHKKLVGELANMVVGGELSLRVLAHNIKDFSAAIDDSKAREDSRKVVLTME